MSDGEHIEPQIDFGVGTGYSVRVDVEIPVGQLCSPSRDDGGPMGYLALTVEEARRLADRLRDTAQAVRDLSP